MIFPDGLIALGIKRQRIFLDDPDKINFLEHLSALLKDSGIKCYAWAVLDNHFPSCKEPELFTPTSNEPRFCQRA
jgi:putative transposase